ncbi:M28 family metallopeptidase [Pontibacter sp. 172403-2]|uniref:M28 family metallopeptidase n=1 Tax=Pontibacter rufus TaxID=2791028 RepID=UPI0018AF6888|nr:M28 family metallopeptidase [Pontibacter sp. 172403-2]MBF9252010.1 M28 family metallopeptidase [Pontibacter sp. 172403-2]
MKKLLLTTFAVGSLTGAFAQSTTIIQKDPQIEAMVKEVSADSLQSYIHTLVSFGTRHTLSTQKDTRAGVGAAKSWVLSKFNQFAKQSGGRLTAVIDSTIYQPDGKRVDKPINLGNVVATLKGTDPNDNRIFIISGHMDSRRSDVMDGKGISPGANDDGSGTAAVIECARVMSKHAFPATIIFVAVTGEEQGLLGARYMADKAKKENWNIEAVLNNDMVGSNNSNETNIINNTQVRVFSEGLPAYEMEKNVAEIRQYGLENEGKARQLARYMKEVGERYTDNLEVVMVYRNDRFGRGGDHTPFVENGYAAVRVTEMNENFQHQHQDLRTENGIRYGDLEEFMDFEYLRKNTVLDLATLANLAKSPSMPQEVVFDFKGLGNSTALTWKKPAAGNVKGYYVMMRETTSPVWQKKFFTAATEINLPYSKDNYLFAVQSVSNDGNESLPVIPKVVRRQPQQAQPSQQPQQSKSTKKQSRKSKK